MKKLNLFAKGVLTGLAVIVLGASPSKAQYQPDEHTVALYHFDEGQGTTAFDSSQYGNDGELRFGAQWSEGFFNGGLSLDGVVQHVLTPHDSTLNLIDFTIEARVKFAQGYNTNHRFIVSKGYQNENRNYELFYSIDNGGFFRVEFYDVNLQEHIADYPFIPGVDRWYHIAGSFQGSFPTSTLKLWLDGDNVTSRGITPAQPAFSTRPLNIGVRDSPESPKHPFKGTIDEVRISNIARNFSTVSILESYPSIQASSWGGIKSTFK